MGPPGSCWPQEPCYQSREQVVSSNGIDKTGTCVLRGSRSSLLWLFHWHNWISKSRSFPDSKVHGANMGPIWSRQDPGGPHVGPMNFVIWVVFRDESWCFSPRSVLHPQEVIYQILRNHMPATSVTCSQFNTITHSMSLWWIFQPSSILSNWFGDCFDCVSRTPRP